MIITGKMSTFGGPADTGVGPDEGLALITEVDLQEWWFSRLFLPDQPLETTGLARRLNPHAFYLAMRWAQHGIGRVKARRSLFRITNPGNDLTLFAQGADYGPAGWTARVCDMSPGCASTLLLSTDDHVEVEMIT